MHGRAHRRDDRVREDVARQQRGHALVQRARSATGRRPARSPRGRARSRPWPGRGPAGRRSARASPARPRRPRPPARRSPPRSRARRSRAHGRARRPGPTATSPGSPRARSSTAGPGRSSSRGQGSGLWPHSPPTPFGPPAGAPADRDAAAGAGADDHAEDDRGARGGPVDRLRQREAVGVVREAQPPRQHAREVVGEAAAVQPDRVRVLDEARDGPIVPGMPTPTAACSPRSRSMSVTRPAIAASVPS